MNETRRIVIMSLAGLLIGSLMFIFGISIQSSIIPAMIYYVISMLLYISSFLAVYNNHKKENHAIYKYIMILTIFLICLITGTIFTHI